jgi:hypothetical protein
VWAAHPVGAKERLAMGLLLYAGQRLSDVIGFGPHKIKNGWLVHAIQEPQPKTDSHGNPGKARIVGPD